MDARSSRYHDVYARWQRDPQGFWGEAARDIDWYEPPKKIFDKDAGIYGRWFTGGVVNTCYNALDRHIPQRNNQAALIYDSPVTNTKQTFTYGRMLSEVQLLGAMLRDFGVAKGDRVIIYMPMVPEAVFAMLACARIGAVHSVVFGGFAAKELATRIDDAKPKVILSASCGIEGARVIPYKPLLDEAIKLAQHKPGACMILQRPQCDGGTGRRPRPRLGQSVGTRRQLRQDQRVRAGRRHRSALHPLHLGHDRHPQGRGARQWRPPGRAEMVDAISLRRQSRRSVVVGLRRRLGGRPFLHRLCAAVPRLHLDPVRGQAGRHARRRRLLARLRRPRRGVAVHRADGVPRHPQGGPGRQAAQAIRPRKFRALFLAGERADPPTIQWAEQHLKVPVLDHWWQTETGWCIAGNPLGLGALPVKYGSACVPMPGYQIDIVDEACHPVPANKIGSIVVKLPLPPANFPTLWQQDDRFQESYLDEFPGYYKTADAGYKDEDGYVYVMSRTDDIINVAGHRLSTGGMEEVLAGHPDVAECAVLGIKDELKGEVPCGFIVLKAGVNRPPQRDREGDRGAGAREDRPGRGVQARHHRGAAAEDALRQDPARHHQEDRRRRQVDHAGDHRRPGDPRRDHRRVEGARGGVVKITVMAGLVPAIHVLLKYSDGYFFTFAMASAAFSFGLSRQRSMNRSDCFRSVSRLNLELPDFPEEVAVQESNRDVTVGAAVTHDVFAQKLFDGAVAHLLRMTGSRSEHRGRHDRSAENSIAR